MRSLRGSRGPSRARESSPSRRATPNLLSGGQAQLVALASVLALRPTYLVLDEPTSQLDPFGTRLVGQALVDLARETGTGILIVEHKTDLLARMADEVVALDGGRIVLRGPAQSVLSDARLVSIGVEPPSSVRVTHALDAAGWNRDRDDAEAIVAALRDANRLAVPGEAIATP